MTGEDSRIVPWYVVYTKPRRERFAMENLSRQRYRVYFPELKIVKNAHGLQRIGFEALFPRYIFCQPDHSEHSIAPVRSTFGVSALVRFGGVPALVRCATIDSIRQLENKQHELDVTELGGLTPGKAVVITSGPLAGFGGLIATVSRQRVGVLMRLLGEETKVQLSPIDLRPAA